MKKFIWLGWGVISIVLAFYFGQIMFINEDKSQFLIGEATHGHFQIELACESCHSSAFGGEDVLQDACVNCHAAELEAAHDSHPKKKFTDPREAFRLEIIDARYCISCHTEHQEEQTRAMGVTLPDDYCYHCHKEVLEERESHKDLAFDSCASAGCHNYHDNRALYESFLVEHAGQPWVKEIALIAQTTATKPLVKDALTLENSQYQEVISSHPKESQDWHMSSHAAAGVDCGGCHNNQGSNEWIAKPSLTQCATCHANEVKGFTSGKHGMRLAATLSQTLNPMTPEESSLDFHNTAMATEHGCNACHGAHSFDTQHAAVEGCLSCHADEHSLAYKHSPHFGMWEKELRGEVAEGSGVTCATCHMPRLQDKEDKDKVYVEHNQNMNLRPNEKMIRTVCMNCHGLEFAIDALADGALIRKNFSGKPGIHIESVDWALEREKKDE